MTKIDAPATGRRETDEIEISPEMIEAGAIAYGSFDAGDSLEWILAAVYSAMEEARRCGSVSHVQPLKPPSAIDAILSLRCLPAFHT